MKRKRILAISGSTRKGSSNESILQYIANTFREELEVEIYTQIDRLPHFNPDLDNEDPPAPVKELRAKLRSSDGVIICTPEYVFSLPGSLKNVIEWNVSTTIFSGKPVAIIVASASGEKAFESLGLVMTTIEAKISDGAKLLIKGAKGKIARDEILDPATQDQILKLVTSLVASIG